MSKVLLSEMTWPEVRDLLRKAEIALIPTGSTEQHGPHLPLKHDIATALYVSVRAAEKLYPKVLVSVPLPIGFSPVHMKFPGSLTVEADTLIRLIHDTCRSLKCHGLKNIAIVNGHGGNTPILAIAARRAKDELGLNVAYISYWDAIPKKTVIQVLGSEVYPGHAALFETSTALFTHPELVKKEYAPKPEEAASVTYPDLQIRNSYSSPWSKFVLKDTHEVSKTGVQADAGDPTIATREKGEKLIEAAVEGLTTLLRQIF